ncbi:hypothetical protein F511_29584 [Dorcoceras hygrometricum]|uniref:Uncharacterized protein n=1 Tax=Dorcoceras hygrometricum TaxID=472368 RepID=A0A2Z7AWC8_9LAMI|nr:hypothetical protein F511_29584 [Dorcoceras hygrometricum]
MRIRPPEFETSICDVKYHVSLRTICWLSNSLQNPSAAGYAKITQNDDASTNLDDAVLDMPHRYQLLVNQQESILHNDSKPAVALNQTTSLRLQQPAVAQRKLLLLVSTCKPVLARVTPSWILSIVRTNHQQQPSQIQRNCRN